VKVGVATLFPDLMEGALEHGVVGRAKEKGLLDLSLANPRDWASDKHRTVDDRPFGGGPGMVMKVGPLAGAVESLKTTLPDAPVVYLSPQGALFDQSMAQRWKQLGSVILIAGRYEGIDERTA